MLYIMVKNYIIKQLYQAFRGGGHGPHGFLESATGYVLYPDQDHEITEIWFVDVII